MKRFKFLSLKFFKRKHFLLTTIHTKEGKILNIENTTFSTKEEARNKMKRNIQLFIISGDNVYYTSKEIKDTYAIAEIKKESTYCQISKIRI